MSIFSTIHKAACAATTPIRRRNPDEIVLGGLWVVFFAGAILVARQLPGITVIPVGLGAACFSFLTTRKPVGGGLVPVRNAAIGGAVIATAMIMMPPSESKLRMMASVPQKLGDALQTVCWQPDQNVKVVLDKKRYLIEARFPDNHRESLIAGQIGMPASLSRAHFSVTTYHKMWHRHYKSTASFATKLRAADRPDGNDRNCTRLEDLVFRS